MSVFEIAMLVCFGAAWPVSIMKSLRSRQVAGKSLPFLVIVLIGYAAGVLHKLIYHYDLVIFLYVLNALMVTLDIALYLRNRLYHVRKSLEDAAGAGIDQPSDIHGPQGPEADARRASGVKDGSRGGGEAGSRSG